MILPNYRPISVLPTFSKVYERAIYDQIMDHFECHNIFSPNQFGFRRNRKTEDAIVEFENCCLDAFDKGEYCVVLLLDLSRAFDCVSHSILLDKLKYVYNFDRLTLKTIKSYLSERNQRVKSERGMSGTLNVCRGIAQGSIIGPLMFLIFFNDFYFYITKVQGVECFMYADDATITIRGRDFNDVMTKSSDVLAAAKRWATANELSLNEEKTVKLAFGLRKFQFGNPETSKLLGVHITPPSFAFGEHASVIGSKICRNIFLLRRLATTVTRDVLRTAYFALVHSHITYCVLAWGSSPDSEHVFRMQRRAVRVLGGVGYRDDCRDTFARLSILTLPCEYILSCILHANTHKHTLSRNSDYHDYSTRGRNDIRPQHCRLTRSQRSPLYMSITFFNKLPPNTRNLTNSVLKARLKKFLLKNSFYSVQEFLDCSFDVL